VGSPEDRHPLVDQYWLHGDPSAFRAWWPVMVRPSIDLPSALSPILTDRGRLPATFLILVRERVDSRVPSDLNDCSRGARRVALLHVAAPRSLPIGTAMGRDTSEASDPEPPLFGSSASSARNSTGSLRIRLPLTLCYLRSDPLAGRPSPGWPVVRSRSGWSGPLPTPRAPGSPRRGLVLPSSSLCLGERPGCEWRTLRHRRGEAMELAASAEPPRSSQVPPRCTLGAGQPRVAQHKKSAVKRVTAIWAR